MPRRFQFSLRRLFASLTVATVALALLVYQPPLDDAQPVGNNRLWWFMVRFLGFSLLVGLAIGFVTCQRWKGIGTVMLALGCLGVALDIFVYWLASALQHQ